MLNPWRWYIQRCHFFPCFPGIPCLSPIQDILNGFSTDFQCNLVQPAWFSELKWQWEPPITLVKKLCLLYQLLLCHYCTNANLLWQQWLVSSLYMRHILGQSKSTKQNVPWCSNYSYSKPSTNFSQLSLQYQQICHYYDWWSL